MGLYKDITLYMTIIVQRGKKGIKQGFVYMTLTLIGTKLF